MILIWILIWAIWRCVQRARENRRAARATPAPLTTSVVSASPMFISVPPATDEAMSAPPESIPMTEIQDRRTRVSPRPPLASPRMGRQVTDVSDYDTDDSEKKRMFPAAGLGAGGEYFARPGSHSPPNGGSMIGGEAPSTSSGILGKEDSQGDEESEEQRRNEYFAEASRFPPATHEAAPMERLPSIDMNVSATNPFAQQHAMNQPKYTSAAPSPTESAASSPQPPRRKRRK